MEKDVICVDMDGTLVLSDTLLELILSSMRIRPVNLIRFVYLCFDGKAFAKKWIASNSLINPKTLPYNEGLINHLRKKREEGNKIVLVTASDFQVAEKVAEHVGIFDDVLASDGKFNLRGKAKAQKLVEIYGERMFVYAGNEWTDLEVWNHAKSAIVVNAGGRLLKAVEAVTRVDLHLPRHQSRIITLLHSIRCYQWIKNVLVFVPLLAAHKLFTPESFLHVMAIFSAFCMVASGTYIVNDIMDLDTDRGHPNKCRRPFASGALPLYFAFLGPVLMLIGILIGLIISIKCAFVLFAYVILTLLYSSFLKTYPLLDVFQLSAMYTMRIIAGAAAANVVLSPWLLSFSGFIFLSLAFLKRCSEYIKRDPEYYARRGYMLGDDFVLQIMGICASFASVIVLGLYVNSDAANSNYTNPEILWGMVPLFLFWQLRLWLAVSRGYMFDDPILYAAKDWVSRMIFISMVTVYLLAS